MSLALALECAYHIQMHTTSRYLVHRLLGGPGTAYIVPTAAGSLLEARLHICRVPVCSQKNYQQPEKYLTKCDETCKMLQMAVSYCCEPQHALVIDCTIYGFLPSNDL